MPSTQDWINNPLGVVEAMFGKRSNRNYTAWQGAFNSWTQLASELDGYAPRSQLPCLCRAPIIDSVHLMMANVRLECHISWSFIDHVLWIRCMSWFFRLMINRLLHPLLHVRLTFKAYWVHVFTQMTHTQYVALFWLTLACLLPHIIISASFGKCDKHEARPRWFGCSQMRNT